MAAAGLLFNITRHFSRLQPNHFVRHSKTICVAHIPWGCTRREVMEFFEKFGPVNSAHVRRHKDFKYNTLVFFQSHETAKIALSQQNVMFRGQRLILRPLLKTRPTGEKGNA